MLCVAVTAHAEESSGTEEGAAPLGIAFGDISIRADGPGNQVTKEKAELYGNVVLDIPTDAGLIRIMADEVHYDLEAQHVMAKGNVVLSLPGAILAGSSMEYGIETGKADLVDAVAYMLEDGSILRAERIERVGSRRLRVENGIFTTCTQPTPYWSFRIRRGTFDLGEYAYLRGVSFRTSKVPVFYTPYLVWPIKSERASGFLMPDFRSSDRLGQTIALPFYWALADNADLTLSLEAHTKVGVGLQAELDWLPTWKGRSNAEARLIYDTLKNQQRYRVEWQHVQRIGEQIKLRSQIDLVSDFDYFTDYETDLSKASAPGTISRIDLTRAWSWYSLSMRAELQQQFFVGGTVFQRLLTGKRISTQLPEIEWRGRSRRLGNSPVYLSFVSSIVRYQRRIFEQPEGAGGFGVQDESDLVETVNNAYWRVDLAPRFQVPLVKTAWIDLTLLAGWRGTYYTARQDPLDANRVVDKPISRSLWNAGFNISGPRIQRIFRTPRWSYSPKLKHVVEPFIEYRWRPKAAAESSEIIRADPVDTIPGELSDLRYGIRQRFLALRPPERGPTVSLAAASEVSFEALEEQGKRQAARAKVVEAEGAPEGEVPVAEDLSPKEFGSIEVFQSYSLVRELSPKYVVFADPFTGDPLLGSSGRPLTARKGGRSYSPVTARLRLNPTPIHDVNIAYTWDQANRILNETRISSSMMLGAGNYFRGTWFRRRSSNPGAGDPSSIGQFSWGTVTLGGRLRIESSLNYDFEAGALRNQSYGVGYVSQCCKVRLEYDRRDFFENTRQEWSLFVDLTGIGSIFDRKWTDDR